MPESTDAVSIDEWLAHQMGGYTEAQLSAAFDTVKDPENWKNMILARIAPVDGPVTEKHLDLVGRAVTFFTGSVATFTAINDHETGEPNGAYLVEADGYYVACGA